ncbi:MAG: hypothetical protein ABW217_21505 [Polyangiaceae bacterium]
MNTSLSSRAQRLALSGVLLFVVACGGNDTSVLLPVDDGEGSTPPPGDGSEPDGMAPASDPLYAVLTRVSAGPDAVSGILHLVPSLDVAEEVATASGYELPGGGTLAAVRGERAVLFMSYDQPTVTRYEVTPDGALEEGPTLSAASTGAQSLTFVAQPSPELVWLEAYPTLALVPLNPVTMELGEPLELPVLREGYPDSYLGAGVVRDGTLFVPVYHTDFTEGSALPGTEIVVVDAEGSNVDVVRDERCDWGAAQLVGGDIVIGATNTFGAGAYLMGSPGFKAPCLLRIPAGSTTFDPTWTKPFSDWTAPSTAADIVIVADDRAYVRVYDPALAPADPLYYWDYSYIDAWRWAVVDPGSSEPMSVLDDAPAFGRVDRFIVQGTTWTFQYSGEGLGGLSRLARLDASGFSPGLSVHGFIDGVVAVGAP